MNGRLWDVNPRATLLVLTGLLGLGSVCQAQDSPAPDTVRRQDVRTWIFDHDGREWSVQPGASTSLGDTGLFRLVGTTQTLPRGRFAFSFFRDAVDRDPKGTDFATHGFTLALGVLDGLEVFGGVGIENRLKAHYLDEPGAPNDNPFIQSSWETGFGDVWLGGKYSVLGRRSGDRLGLAVRAFVQFGTANPALGLGTGAGAVGGDVVLSRSALGGELHAIAGYEWNDNPEPPVEPEGTALLADDGASFDGPDFVAPAFRWGVGFTLPACTMMQLQAELSGRIYGSTTVPQTDTADLTVGAAFWLSPGLYVRPAYTYALGYDGRGRDVSTARRSSFSVSFGFHSGTPCCQIYVPPPPSPAPANRLPTVSVTCTPSSVLPGAVSNCRATASDPDGDPLTYTWSVTSGRISGSNAEARLDTAGIGAGDCVPVTVRVSDGRGGNAEASTRVCVQEPPAPGPEVLTCTSGGFPRNLSRLNNVDKACLDDVASRLRQDPRSRVIVVGHADSSERNTEVIGRRRSEEVKSYLVGERGVAEARITARSAADSKPLDTAPNARARAKNRRVDVIFVPEGAVVPEED